MALSSEEFRRRVVAAAALKGWDLDDLQAPLEERQFPKHAAARAGRSSDSYMAGRALILVLADILDVPEEWFTAEDVYELIAAPAAEATDATSAAPATSGGGRVGEKAREVAEGLKSSPQGRRRVQRGRPGPQEGGS